MPKKNTTDEQAVLKVTFHWTGNIPRKIKQRWEAMFQPKTITFQIPKTKPGPAGKK